MVLKKAVMSLARLFWWHVGVGRATAGALTTSASIKPGYLALQSSTSISAARDAGVVEPIDGSGFAVLRYLVIFSYCTLSSNPTSTTTLSTDCLDDIDTCITTRHTYSAFRWIFLTPNCCRPPPPRYIVCCVFGDLFPTSTEFDTYLDLHLQVESNSRVSPYRNRLHDRTISRSAITPPNRCFVWPLPHVGILYIDPASYTLPRSQAS